MRWAFDRLGLAPDADERAIKRAYAARLKTTRPEDDPQGFQALNDAYRAALAWSAQHAARTVPASADASSRADLVAGDTPTIATDAARATALDHAAPAEPSAEPDREAHAEPNSEAKPAEPDDTEPPVYRLRMQGPSLVPLPGLTNAHPPARARPQNAMAFAGSAMPPFDAEAFFRELLERSRRLPIAEFSRWLHDNEALYSVALKDALDAPLVRFLEQAPPMRKAYLEETLRFFGLDTVGAKSLRLEAPLHRIRQAARRNEENWDQIMSRDRRLDAERAPVLPSTRRAKSGGVPVWAIVMLVVLLTRCAQELTR
jgi:hypothetical protein